MHKTTSRLFGVAYELKSASLRFSNLLPYELCISISGSSDLRFRRPAPVVYVVDSSSSVLHAESAFCMILGGFRTLIGPTFCSAFRKEPAFQNKSSTRRFQEQSYEVFVCFPARN